MDLLAPGALIWLGSVPVLLWLWRLASTRRQIQIPSLVPFEHLLRRAPKRRSRIVLTPLFCVPLAALLALIFALARPILFQSRPTTTLAVLDTSASMDARHRGQRALDEAKRALLAQVGRKGPAEQWFVMTTAPVRALTPQPTSDAVALTHAIQELRVSHLGGNVSTTAHIGRSLLTVTPDATLVVTDEPRPEARPEDPVQWVTVGGPSPNVAIVGLDVQGPLCSAADASVVATVQNFSDADAEVTIAATQRGRTLTEQGTRFAAQERRSIALTMPEDVEGWVAIALQAADDGLAVDNRAWIDIRRNAALPILVRSESPAFTDTIAAWLAACDALTWTRGAPSQPVPSLVITDAEQAIGPIAAASMVFHPPPVPRPMLSHWVVSASHPIGSYLDPVAVTAAALNLASAQGARPGVPVVTALVRGRNVPVLIADEREGHRTVSLWLDPADSRGSTPVLLAFFNSLRWLIGRADVRTPGEPLMLSGFGAGPVRICRPDGSTEQAEVDGQTVLYDRATLAGLYRFSQGPTEVTVAANFFDPLESNLLERTSTWRVAPAPAPTEAAPPRAAHPVSHLLIVLILILVLVEWWRYSLKGGGPIPSTTAPGR